jgi:hypothetical protein
MLRVRECLELALPLRGPFTKRDFARPGPGSNVREKLCLGHRAICRKSNCLSRRLKRAEIHLGSEVLSARIGQEISADRVLMISPQSTVRSFGHQ